jgi:hypothetical protein
MKSDPATPLPECVEGPEAFARFDAIMAKLLSVPRAVLLAREAEYKRQAALNPSKPGPKPKVKRRRSSSGRAAKS